MKIWLRLSSGELMAKNGILRRGSDEDDPALLDVGQQHVLLGAVEAVQFVDEQDGPPAGLLQFGAGLLEHLAHFLDAGGDGVERPKRHCVCWAMTWARAVLPVPGGP